MEIEIKLLQYTFRFKTLTWREEFSLQLDPKKDHLRTLLALALEEVSGFKIQSQENAWKVLLAIPDSIIHRVFIIYKGSLPEPRVFTTLGLYKAPEPNRFMGKIEQGMEEHEQFINKVEQEMVRQFGRKEVTEALEVERQMAKNSNLRGATIATVEKRLNGN